MTLSKSINKTIYTHIPYTSLPPSASASPSPPPSYVITFFFLYVTSFFKYSEDNRKTHKNLFFLLVLSLHFQFRTHTYIYIIYDKTRQKKQTQDTRKDRQKFLLFFFISDTQFLLSFLSL